MRFKSVLMTCESKKRHRTRCNGCGRFFAYHEHHRRKSGCSGGGVALCEDVDESEEPTGFTQDDFLAGAPDDSAASEVALGLAELKYERGFQRPDVEAAKRFAGVVGKRTRGMAFDCMKGLLKDGVQPADVIAALESAGGQAFNGVETAAQENAHLKRNLPILDVRTTDLGGGHRVASVNVNDAIIRHLQENHALPTPCPPSAPCRELG